MYEKLVWEGGGGGGGGGGCRGQPGGRKKPKKGVLISTNGHQMSKVH